jgi:hypothetical protein
MNLPCHPTSCKKSGDNGDIGDIQYLQGFEPSPLALTYRGQRGHIQLAHAFVDHKNRSVSPMSPNRFPTWGRWKPGICKGVPTVPAKKHGSVK